MKLLFIITLLFVSYYSFAQKENLNKVNQINDKGQKEGLWIDTSNHTVREIYYKDGLESGVFRQYDTDGKLLAFGEYMKGEMCGKWYIFDARGFLLLHFKDFTKNTDSILNEYNKKKYIPDYKCYCISYYLDGSTESEGHLLWSEGETPESDLSVEYGEWKYYDEGGKLIKTKEFK